MKNFFYRTLSFLSLILLSLGHIHCMSVVIRGNEKAKQQETSFPYCIRQCFPGLIAGDTFYVCAAHDAQDPNENTIAATGSGIQYFQGLAIKKLKVNNKNDQDNPLYNSKISQLGMLSQYRVVNNTALVDEYPVLVKADCPSKAFVIDMFFRTEPHLISCEHIRDADGLSDTSGVVGLGNIQLEYVAAAVLPHNSSTFGDKGSGIAFLMLTTANIQKNKKDEKREQLRVLFQVDAPSYEASNKKAVRALPLDRSSAQLKINGDLSTIAPNVQFAWNDNLKVLYAAFQIQTGLAENDGGFAIVRIYKNGIDNLSKFLMLGLAPTKVLDSKDNKIIGAMGSSKNVTIHSINTMYTSTRFDYLIVHGGNGSATSTKNHVYALPLVNSTVAGSTTVGSIANKNEQPDMLGKNEYGFKTAAKELHDMPTADDQATRVGGGPLNIGDISNIYVKDDCIYACVAQAYGNQKPGIFYSQAIFDHTGKIKAWTRWQRVAAITDPCFCAALNGQGNFTYLTGSNSQTLNTVKRTVWINENKESTSSGLFSNAKKEDDVSLCGQLEIQFPKNKGGIQKIFDFPNFTPGLCGTSLILATGLRKIALAITGDSSSGVYTPSPGNFNKDTEIFSSATITKDLPESGTQPNIIVFSGGALENLGPITCAVIAQHDNNARLFVGASSGLAALVNPDGSGWNTHHGLAAHFKGLRKGMSFKKVGNYSFVRKVIHDGQFLYVMTDKKVDRINLSTSNFATNALDIVTMATIETIDEKNKTCSLLDFIASGKFGLLATSKGLFRVANGCNIMTAQKTDAVSWKEVVMPQSLGAALSFWPITTTGMLQDCARYGGSTVYVLNGYIGKNKSQLLRFSIEDVSSREIDDATIRILPDFFEPKVSSYLFNLNNFMDKIENFGTGYFGCEHKKLEQNQLVHLLLGLRSGVGTSKKQQLSIDPQSFSLIQHIMHSCA